MCFPAPQSKLTLAQRLPACRPPSLAHKHTRMRILYQAASATAIVGGTEDQAAFSNDARTDKSPEMRAGHQVFAPLSRPVSGHCLCSKLNYSINGCVLQHQRWLSHCLCPGPDRTRPKADSSFMNYLIFSVFRFNSSKG